MAASFAIAASRSTAPMTILLDFAYVIQVKENAPELLRRALSRLPVDMVMHRRLPGRRAQVRPVAPDAGGVPGAGLSRLRPGALAAGAARPGLARRRSTQRARRVVVFSIDLGARFARLRARLPDGAAGPAAWTSGSRPWSRSRRAGILTGSMHDAHPARPVRQRREPGGDRALDGRSTAAQFVLAGGPDPGRPAARLLLRRSARALSRPAAALPSGSTRRAATAPARRRLARPWPAHPQSCASGTASPTACPARSSPATSEPSNKRVVEELAKPGLRHGDGEARQASASWAYRKAAWAIEDLEQDIGLVYRQMGRKGLEGIENVGPRLAGVIGAWIRNGPARSMRRCLAHRSDGLGIPGSVRL